MTPNRLRDILLARGGRISLDDLRKCDSYKSDPALFDAIRFLVSVDLAVQTDRTVQAKRGCGRLVEPTTRHVRAEGQNPAGTIPRMSSGSPRAAAKRIKTREKMIPEVIEALRRGVPQKQALAIAGFRCDIAHVSVVYREKLREAKREGLALRSAAA